MAPRVAAPAPPVVEPSVPIEIGEGGVGELAPIVSDPDGDELTLDWDLDGDGTFGDSSQPTVQWSAAGIDGPAGGFAVHFRVGDGTSTVPGTMTIDVLNVPPIFSEEGPQYVAVDHAWSMVLVVSDPGDDEVTLRPIDIPDGADLDPDNGVLRWTPDDSALGRRRSERPWTLTVAAEDDDGGTTLHAIELTVGENRPPPMPDLLTTALSAEAPAIRLSTVTDPDGDEVQIVVDLDANLCFCSVDLQDSGLLAQGDPTTEWRPSRPLDLEWHNQFYVRWRATDGDAVSEYGNRSFVVEGPVPDAGPGAAPAPEPTCADDPGLCPEPPPCYPCRGAGLPTRQERPPLGIAAVLLLLIRRNRRPTAATSTSRDRDGLGAP